MTIIGYPVVALALYLLYIGEIFFGIGLFAVGGFIAKKIFVSLRSIGVILLVGSISFGYHNGFSVFVLFLIFIGFTMACFNDRRASRDHDPGWGIEIGELFSGSDSNDSGFGGDGGGD